MMTTLQRPTLRLRLLTMLCLVVACALAGCSIGGNTMPEANETLDGRVLDAATNGAELRLADATDFDWDQAGFVTEGTPASDIEAAFGDPVSKEKRYTASPVLFIFLKDGKVTKAVRITPDAFFGAQSLKKYGRDVVLAPAEGSRGFLNWRE
jgi:hypothetical protein